MAVTKSRGVKDALDKFYTKPEIAKFCISRLNLDEFVRIIEPSAGAGAFSDILMGDLNTAQRTLAFDLAPENPMVIKQDWFEFDERESRGKTLVIGNPPFGRQSSLALRFIRHAFEVVGADTVAFILPRSFMKDSVQDRVYPFARLIEQVPLPQNSFTLHGEDYSLPAVFQVWERADGERRSRARGALHSRHVTFVKKDGDPHIVVRRVGGRAGVAYLPTSSASDQSNYFLRLKKKDPGSEDIIHAISVINSLPFDEAKNGTGPNSLSKREFVRHFDREFAKAETIETFEPSHLSVPDTDYEAVAA